MKSAISLTACSIAALLAFQVLASPPPQQSVADLASTLQTQRDVCANLAAEAKRTFDLAQYKSGLDRDTAALQAEMDARVYGIGHGRRQTAEYYAQQLQNASAQQRDRDKATTDAFIAAGQEVAQCVSDLKEQGKSTYVEFKQRTASKSVRSQAETLMASWLANVSEISTATPNGEDASFTAWKNAKAAAEVAAL